MKISHKAHRAGKELQDLLASNDPAERSSARKLIDLSDGSIDSAAKKWRQAVEVALATREIDGDIALAEQLALETIGQRSRQDVISSPRLKAMPLPTPCEPFVGRGDELADARDCIDRGGNLAIVGPPGVGKTEFGAMLIRDTNITRAFENRFWIFCDGATSAELLYNNVCRSLGIPRAADPIADILDVARSVKDSLYLFDGIDSPWTSDPNLTEDLLKQLSPYGQIVITSSGGQRPAGLAWSTIRLQPFPLRETCEMFEVMLERSVPPDAQTSLWKATDGLPLAIVSMAHEAQLEPNLEVFLDDAAEQDSSFVTSPRLTKRLATAVASIATTPEEGHSLTRLALCPDGLDIQELTAACSMPSSVRRRALGSGLAQEIAYLESPEGGYRHRLRLLEPLRRHLLAGPIGRESTLESEITSPLLTYLIKKAQALEADEPPGPSSLSMLTLRWDLPNYVAILPLLPFDTDQAMMLRILTIGSVLRWARRLGVDVSAQLLHDLNLKIGNTPSPTVRALMDMLEGDLALASGQPTAAKTAFRAAIDHAPVGTVLAANGHKRLADALFCASELDDAYGLYGQAIKFYDDARCQLGTANSLTYLGELSIRDSKPERAREQLSEALRLHQLCHNSLGTANCNFLLAEVELAFFMTEEALRRFELITAEYQRLGADLGEANCRIRLAELAVLTRNTSSYDSNFKRADLLARSTQNSLALGHVLEIKGRQMVVDDPSQALICFDEAESCFGSAGDALGVSWVSLQRQTVSLLSKNKPDRPNIDELSRTPVHSIAERDFRWRAFRSILQVLSIDSATNVAECHAAFASIPSIAERKVFESTLESRNLLELLASLPETRSFLTFSREPAV